MKKTFNLMVMLLCAASITVFSSCSKGDNNSGSSGRSDEVINVKYSMGYYHPAKKIKKVLAGLEQDVYEFSWDGDDLKSIKYTDANFGITRTYYCHYSKNGYITSWTTHIEGEEDRVENVTYEANSIYTNRETVFGTMKWDEHTFDYNGVLIRDGSTLVTMQNGNVIKHGTTTIVYDNHPNPLLNLWPPSDSFSFLSPLYAGGGHSYAFDVGFFSKNNGLTSTLADTTRDYYWYIVYDQDGWPIRWHSYEKIHELTDTWYMIEYYN